MLFRVVRLNYATGLLQANRPYRIEDDPHVPFVVGTMVLLVGKIVVVSKKRRHVIFMLDGLNVVLY